MPRNRLLDKRLEAHVRDFWPDTCTIQSPTIVRDSLGANVRTYADAYTNVPCRITRFDRQSFKVDVAEQAIGLSDWVVFFEKNQTFDLEDHIVTSNLNLEPIDINDDQSLRIGKRVMCKELRTG